MNFINASSYVILNFVTYCNYLLHIFAALTWSLGFHPKSSTSSWDSPEIFNHYLFFRYPKTHSLSFSKYSSHLRWLSSYHWHNNSPKVLAETLESCLTSFSITLSTDIKSPCPFSIDFYIFLFFPTWPTLIQILPQQLRISLKMHIDLPENCFYTSFLNI